MLTIEPTFTTGDRAILRLTGDFGFEAAGEVSAALTLLESRGPGLLVIDLCHVELIDSSGLRVIVEADRRARTAGRTVEVLAAAGTAPRRLLELTLLTDLLSVRESADG